MEPRMQRAGGVGHGDSFGRIGNAAPKVYWLCCLRELESQPASMRRLGRCFRLASKNIMGGAPVAEGSY